MKKIGILSLYYHNVNLGGQLQAWALVQLLRKKGIEAEQICFDWQYRDWNIRKKNFLLWGFAKQLSPVYWINYLRKRLEVRKQQSAQPAVPQEIQNKLAIQKQRFTAFANGISHSPQVYTPKNLHQLNRLYDVFIIGSDQVFALYLLTLNAYYGLFAAPAKKVIAYAASSNTRQFPPRAEKLFVQNLSRFNALSVREKALQTYIEHITTQQAAVVLDPTFLLCKADWQQLMPALAPATKKYILCYLLGEKSLWQRQVIRAYADRYGYEIRSVYVQCPTHTLDTILQAEACCDVGPREFITLLNGAACVCTDSFHGLAFAINFGKNFYVFDRDDQSGENSMNARITDTLELFGLTTRHITDKQAVLTDTVIDFTQAHQILEREKEKSINWLLNALKD